MAASLVKAPEGDVVEWIHRSAHDFILSPDGSGSPLRNSYSGRADLCKTFLLGSVKLLAVSPSFGDRHDTTSVHRLTSLIKLTDRLTDTDTAMAVEIAEEMRLVVCSMHNEDFNRCLLPYALEELDSSLNAFSFWAECFDAEAVSLIEALVPVLLSEPAGNALLMPLWDRVTSGVRYDDNFIERVMMPFLKKIEQNIWLSSKASAKVVLYFRAEQSPEGENQAAWHLSCTTPDFLGPKQPAAMHVFIRPYFDGTSAGADEEMALPYLDRIAESIRLFCDITLSTGGIMRMKQYRVLLQCSPRLHRYFQNDSLKLGMLPECYNELRIICRPAGFALSMSGIGEGREEFYGEITEYVCLAPSLRTCSCLCQDIRQEVDKACYGNFTLSNDTMLRQWTQMFVEDIWENAESLDATQQLFALACVKWTIPRWVGSTVVFHEEC